MSEQKSLTVNIADKIFKIKIETEREVDFLNKLKIINLKIKDLKKTYPGLHLQEYLSMVIIWVASEKSIQGDHFSEKESENQQLFMEKLSLWNNLLNIENEL